MLEALNDFLIGAGLVDHLSHGAASPDELLDQSWRHRLGLGRAMCGLRSKRIAQRIIDDELETFALSVGCNNGALLDTHKTELLHCASRFSSRSHTDANAVMFSPLKRGAVT